MLDHMARTRIVLSFTVSSPVSTTRPSLNSPTFVDSVPTLLFAKD